MNRQDGSGRELQQPFYGQSGFREMTSSLGENGWNGETFFAALFRLWYWGQDSATGHIRVEELMKGWAKVLGL